MKGEPFTVDLSRIDEGEEDVDTIVANILKEAEGRGRTLDDEAISQIRISVLESIRIGKDCQIISSKLDTAITHQLCNPENQGKTPPSSWPSTHIAYLCTLLIAIVEDAAEAHHRLVGAVRALGDMSVGVVLQEECLDIVRTVSSLYKTLQMIEGRYEGHMHLIDSIVDKGAGEVSEKRKEINKSYDPGGWSTGN